MTRIHKNLWCNRLPRDMRAMACGYWFTVTSSTTPHCAHRTRRDLARWLDWLGLSLESSLDAPGSCRVIGEYAEECLMESRVEFDRRPGRRVRWLSNGDYTTAVLYRPFEGSIVHVAYLNPNVRDRQVWDYAESERLLDRQWIEDEAAAMAN